MDLREMIGVPDRERIALEQFCATRGDEAAPIREALDMRDYMLEMADAAVSL